MRPKFDELIVNAKVINCKECKNGKYYVTLQNLDNNSKFDLFSKIPYNIGVEYELELWKVTDIKFYVKKDK